LEGYLKNWREHSRVFVGRKKRVRERNSFRKEQNESE